MERSVGKLYPTELLFHCSKGLSLVRSGDELTENSVAILDQAVQLPLARSLRDLHTRVSARHAVGNSVLE